MKMRDIVFDKMVASGNDFIVIDNRNHGIKSLKDFSRKLCAVHTSVGADGVLFLEKSSKAAFKMRIVNSDGSEAEACGNGFRCISLYAYEKLGLPRQFKFESISGIVTAQIIDQRVRVGLPRPKDYRERKTIEVSGSRLHYSFINTGVPHTVILVEGLSKVDVQTLGRAIREHKTFKPKGTNVNFVELKSVNQIEVRTYERGVEAETLACGTGSTASAIIATLSGYGKPPIFVKTKGGETLTIDFKIQGTQVTDVTLEGEAKFVFEGKLKL